MGAVRSQPEQTLMPKMPKLQKLSDPGSPNAAFHSPRLPEGSSFSRAIPEAVAEPDSPFLEGFQIGLLFLVWVGSVWMTQHLRTQEPSLPVLVPMFFHLNPRQDPSRRTLSLLVSLLPFYFHSSLLPPSPTLENPSSV